MSGIGYFVGIINWISGAEFNPEPKDVQTQTGGTDGTGCTQPLTGKTYRWPVSNLPNSLNKRRRGPDYKRLHGVRKTTLWRSTLPTVPEVYSGPCTPEFDEMLTEPAPSDRTGQSQGLPKWGEVVALRGENFSVCDEQVHDTNEVSRGLRRVDIRQQEITGTRARFCRELEVDNIYTEEVVDDEKYATFADISLEHAEKYGYVTESEVEVLEAYEEGNYDEELDDPRYSRFGYVYRSNGRKKIGENWLDELDY